MQLVEDFSACINVLKFAIPPRFVENPPKPAFAS